MRDSLFILRRGKQIEIVTLGEKLKIPLLLDHNMPLTDADLASYGYLLGLIDDTIPVMLIELPDNRLPPPKSENAPLVPLLPDGVVLNLVGVNNAKAAQRINETDYTLLRHALARAAGEVRLLKFTSSIGGDGPIRLSTETETDLEEPVKVA